MMRFLFSFFFMVAVMVSAEPCRVVSLSPSLTELVCALGFASNLVGRSDACDYPPEAKNLPIAGSFGKPNLEALYALKPTHVLITDLEKPALLDSMRSENIKPLVLPCESWSSLMLAALTFSQEMGDPQRGEQWIRRMNQRREALSARVETFYKTKFRPRVYVEVWGDPLTTVGKKTFLDDIVTLAGGLNLGHTLTTAYAHISPEWILKEDPDAILVTYQRDNAAQLVEQLAGRPGWLSLKAVKSHTICAEINEDLLARPGPRLIEGAEKLADWLMNHVNPE